MSALRRLSLAVVPALLVLSAAPASAQTARGPNRHVAVDARVEANATESYAFEPDSPGHICNPGAVPVPGDCSEQRSARSTAPDGSSLVNAAIRPPLNATTTTLVEAESHERHDLDWSREGDVRRIDAEVSALQRVRGPNEGTMTAGAQGAIDVAFRVRSFGRKTAGRLTGLLRVRASDPVNLLYTPPYRPARVEAVLRLASADGSLVLVEQRLTVEASGGQFVELPIDERFTVPNGQWRLSLASNGQASHFGSGAASVPSGATSEGEAAASALLVLENGALRR